MYLRKRYVYAVNVSENASLPQLFFTNYAGVIELTRAPFYSDHTCLRLKFSLLALGDFPLSNGFYSDSVPYILHMQIKKWKIILAPTLAGLYENKNIVNVKYIHKAAVLKEIRWIMKSTERPKQENKLSFRKNWFMIQLEDDRSQNIKKVLLKYDWSLKSIKRRQAFMSVLWRM